MTLAEIHPGLVDDNIAEMFSYLDSDVYIHGSTLLQSKIMDERIEVNNRIHHFGGSSVICAELRRKVFGPNLEFIPIRPSDWFNTSIFLYYDSIMDNVAINPMSNPLYYDQGLGQSDSMHSLQIYYGSDYSGVTPSTTMSNLQEFIRDYEMAYQSTVPNQRGTQFGDVWGLIQDHGFGMFGQLRRKTDNIPIPIRLMLYKLGILNLHDASSKILFEKYLEKTGWV